MTSNDILISGGTTYVDNNGMRHRWLLVSELVRNYGALGYPDSAAALLEYYGRHQEALAFYLYTGNMDKAADILELLPDDTDEEQSFLTLAGYTYLLLENGEDWNDLDEEDRNVILAMAAPNSVPGSWAAAIAAQLGVQPFIWPRPDAVGSAKPTASNAGENGQNIRNISTYKNSFTLFPNPTSGRFTIHTSEEAELTIKNLQGVMIARYTIKPGNNDLTLPQQVSAGIYLINVVDNKGISQIVKLIYYP